MLASRLRSPRALTLLDQSVSSLTNFLAGLVAAHTLAPDAFGAFGVWTFVYIVLLGTSRSAFTDVGAVTPLSSGGREAQLAAIDVIFWLTVAALAIASTSLVAVDVSTIGALTGVLFMLVQDATRIASIAGGRPAQALKNDTLWLAALASLFVLATVTDVRFTAELVTMLWGFAAVPGIVASMRWNAWRPNLQRAGRFVTSRARTSAAFSVDWILKQGTAQLATYGIGLLGGLAAVAGIRAGLLLLGPLNIAFTGLQLAALPMAVRLKEQDPRRMRQALRVLSLTLASVSVGMGLALSLMPPAWLELIVGDQATGLADYVMPLAFALAGSGLMTATHMELRVRQAGAELVGARVISTVLYLSCGAAALWAFKGDINAGLWGLAIGTLAGAGVWELQLRKRFPLRA